MRHLIHGLAAGAADTAVLNTITYLDMAIRARPSSSVLAATVDKMTDLAGIPLAAEGHGSDSPGGEP